jgi:hypothetical protein
MSPAFRLTLALACALALAPSATAGQQAAENKEEQQPPTWNASETRTIELFPAGEVFPVYAADPHRPTNQLAIAFYPTNEIPDTRSPRAMLSAGGRFGVLRIDASSPDSWDWQISVDAGFDGVIDSRNSHEVVGWDGNYGLAVTTAKASSPFAFKVALLHVSAHLGDEYQRRTQAHRIEYTREELALAASFRPRTRMRIYGEFGAAFTMRSAQQERARWQMGAEYERPPTVFGGRMAWYGAVDLSLLDERDWRLDTCLQGGLVTRNNGRTVRLFGQWYDGRPTIGQFTAYSESAMSVGLRVDL